MNADVSALLERLASELDLRRIVQFQAGYGRRDLPPVVVSSLAAVNLLCGEIKRAAEYRDLPEDAKRRVELAELIVKVPRAVDPAAVDYASYIDVPLLYWHLYGRAAPFPAPTPAVAQLVFALARHLEQMEKGEEGPWFRERRAPTTVNGRLSLLREVTAIAAGGDFHPEGTKADKPIDSLAIAALPENSLAVAVQFSGFAQTTVPDEFLFVRCLQMSELCFLGIRDSVTQAMHGMAGAGYAERSRFLGAAARFADLLLAILRLLHTLSREDFLRFRELTGNSSAVQSFNYQSMGIILYGTNNAKERLLADNGHYRALIEATNMEGSTSLAEYLRTVPGDSSDTGAVQFLSAARKLDRRLLGWRSFHLRIASEYVPSGKMGTGGTEGVPYLRRIVQERLFPDSDHDEEART